MGAYVTTTSISLILPGFLKGNTTTSDAEGAAIFSEKIDDAEAMVNAQLAKLYSLPFTSTAVPPAIRTITKHIACYYTFQSTSYRSGTENPYVKEFKEATRTIESVGKGEMTLSYTDGSIVPRKSSERILSNTENYTPIFGLDEPENWDRDTDEIDDQDDARS